MKFGKHMQEHMDPEWLVSSVPYKELKKLLKQGGLADLNRGICTDDFLACSNTSIIDASVELGGQSSQETPGGVFTRNGGMMFNEKLHQAIVDVNKFVLERLARFDEPSMMSNVTSFAEMNIMAIVKIVKKHDKKWGFSTELHELVQSMRSMEFVQELAHVGSLGCLQLLQQWHFQHTKQDSTKLIRTPGDSQNMLFDDDQSSLEPSSSGMLGKYTHGRLFRPYGFSVYAENLDVIIIEHH
jgi:hypothetical protein